VPVPSLAKLTLCNFVPCQDVCSECRNNFQDYLENRVLQLFHPALEEARDIMTWNAAKVDGALFLQLNQLGVFIWNAVDFLALQLNQYPEVLMNPIHALQNKVVASYCRIENLPEDVIQGVAVHLKGKFCKVCCLE
jgi:hypothetical protein